MIFFERLVVAPENVTIDRPVIDVEEGSIGGVIECDAAAYPQANYYWQHNDQIIGKFDLFPFFFSFFFFVLITIINSQLYELFNFNWI